MRKVRRLKKNGTDQQIYAKFRAAIYKKYKGICPECGGSLHNGERIELHHIIGRKNNGKYSMTNIQPLHQICHQQPPVTHRKLKGELCFARERCKYDPGGCEARASDEGGGGHREDDNN